jgi:NAD(P)-dependent dehydrogenase (short-subunit alcohol dehydrogenase family)
MDTILITGANRGIGLALTRVFLEKENVVIAACRTPSIALKELEMIHADRIDLVQFDVTDEPAVMDVANQVREQRDAIDVIINNAAIMPEQGSESILELDLRLIADAFDTNVLGCARVTRAFYPLLKQSRRPRILNLTSGLGSISHKDAPEYYPYSISKAALNMLTRTMSFEFAAKGIVTVAISPGWVKTDMGGEEAELTPEESARAIVETIQELRPELSGEFLDRHGRRSEYAW